MKPLLTLLPLENSPDDHHNVTTAALDGEFIRALKTACVTNQFLQGLRLGW
jgi:hypothetical protein